jgi:hypothetical protein
MNRLLFLAVALGAAYVYLDHSGSPMLRQMHLSGGVTAGGSLNPVMGGMAGSAVGGAAVKAAGKLGG